MHLSVKTGHAVPDASTQQLSKDSHNGTRIGLFGVFYPEYQKCGNSTTGLALALNSDPDVKSIDVFSQRDSEIPTTVGTQKLKLHETWAIDRPLSLVVAARRMFKFTDKLDSFIFNIHMTSFGTGRLVNGLGLLLPVLMRKVTRKQVLVYMHNFASTQDVSALGYEKLSFLTLKSVSFLERTLLRSVEVIVPLESMAIGLEDKYGVRPRVIFLPYIEAMLSSIAYRNRRLPVAGSSAKRRKPHVLYFGHFGPQKDLGGAIDLLENMLKSGQITCTIAGSVNMNFKDYIDVFRGIKCRLEGAGAAFDINVPETDILRLVSSADVVLLAYNATGGYSGTMNTAAVCGALMVATDLKQLRETAAATQADVVFVPPQDYLAMKEAILSQGARSLANAKGDLSGLVDDSLTKLRHAVHSLVTIVNSKA